MRTKKEQENHEAEQVSHRRALRSALSAAQNRRQVSLKLALVLGIELLILAAAVAGFTDFVVR